MSPLSKDVVVPNSVPKLQECQCNRFPEVISIPTLKLAHRLPQEAWNEKVLVLSFQYFWAGPPWSAWPVRFPRPVKMPKTGQMTGHDRSDLKPCLSNSYQCLQRYRHRQTRCQYSLNSFLTLTLCHWSKQCLNLHRARLTRTKLL